MGLEQPPPKRASYTLHIASVAGHDREGRDPFPVARLRLVRLLDEALNLIDHEPRFGQFTLDGGAIGIEDYLTLRPEHFERVERAVRTRRLLLGPWYVQPSAIHPDVEISIRNLLLGLRTCRVFGRPLMTGYLPGIPAQRLPGFLPGVLKGFGIETAILAADDGAPLEGELLGDDGTRLPFGSVIDGAGGGIARGAYAHSISGHALVACPWFSSPSRQARLAFLRAVPDLKGAPQDDAFHSSPEGYAAALRKLPLVGDGLHCLQLDESPASPDPADPLAAMARRLCAVVEPLAVLGEHAAPLDDEWHLRRPVAAIRAMWQLLLECLGGDAAETAARLRRIEAMAAALCAPLHGLHGGDPASAPESCFAQVIRVSAPGFRILAARLPEDAGRGGFIVRGVNATAAPLSVTLTPWRRFGAAGVMTLDETPTGGTMGLDADGAMRFQAAPHRLLTFWFHD